MKQFPEDITFLKEQLKNHSLLQKLAKRENIVVEWNHVSSHKTSDKMHCSVLSDRKEVQQNATHEELLWYTSVTINKIVNMTAATENRNLTAKTGNGNKHQQNRKNIQNKKKIKNQTKNRKNENQFSY